MCLMDVFAREIYLTIVNIIMFRSQSKLGLCLGRSWVERIPMFEHLPRHPPRIAGGGGECPELSLQAQRQY